MTCVSIRAVSSSGLLPLGNNAFPSPCASYNIDGGMLETYDSAMLDSTTDQDIAMGAGSPSTWYAADAVMDAEYAPATEEVDMAYYDGPEYDMVDADVYEEEAPGIQDADIIDASRLPSPVPETLPVLPPLEYFHEAPQTLTDTEEYSFPHEDIAAPVTAMLAPVVVVSSPVPTAAFHLEPESSPVPLMRSLDEEHAETVGGTASVLIPPPSDTAHEGVDEDESSRAEGIFEAPSREEIIHNPSEPLPLHDSHDATEEDEGVSVAHPDDGLVIEPPPVTLTVTQDNSSFYLFDRLDASGSANETPALTVLFADRLTLYYEPLSLVFQALRADDSFAGRYEDAELVISAPKLQLIITEDNRHADDVSLCDLNLLHDGWGLAGPLQICLDASLPRFFRRYQELKADLAKSLAGQDEYGVEYQESALATQSSPSQTDGELPLPTPQDVESDEQVSHVVTAAATNHATDVDGNDDGDAEADADADAEKSHVGSVTFEAATSQFGGDSDHVHEPAVIECGARGEGDGNDDSADEFETNAPVAPALDDGDDEARDLADEEQYPGPESLAIISVHGAEEAGRDAGHDDREIYEEDDYSAVPIDVAGDFAHPDDLAYDIHSSDADIQEPSRTRELSEAPPTPPTHAAALTEPLDGAANVEDLDADASGDDEVYDYPDDHATISNSSLDQTKTLSASSSKRSHHELEEEEAVAPGEPLQESNHDHESKRVRLV